MAFDYKRERTNKALKDILAEYGAELQAATDSSRDAYLKTLQPGAVVPAGRQFYQEKDRQEFEKKCSGLRDRAGRAIGDFKKELLAKLTEAPSTEAVNAVTLLKMRSNVTRDELAAMLDRYGDNPQVYSAIKEIAGENRIHGFADHPVSAEMQRLEVVEANVMNTLSAVRTPSDGYLAMLGMQIDGDF